MTRTRAAKKTAATIAACMALAAAMERWPYGTMATLGALTIYAKFRQIPDSEPS